jgi:hypothetical protein
MFLGTMNLPASGETLALGDSALACCRQQLCPKFTCYLLLNLITNPVDLSRVTELDFTSLLACRQQLKETCFLLYLR